MTVAAVTAGAAEGVLAATRLRLVMMGTGPFAVPTFRALFDTPHTVLALVTQPARSPRASSSSEEATTPMRAVAHEHGTPVGGPTA